MAPLCISIMKTCVFSSFSLLTLKLFENSIENCLHQCHYWWTSSSWCVVDPITFSVVAPRKNLMPQALAASLRSRAKEVQGFWDFPGNCLYRTRVFSDALILYRACTRFFAGSCGWIWYTIIMNNIWLDYIFTYICNIEFHVLYGAAIEQLYECV